MHGHRIRERLFRPITVRKHRGAREAPKIEALVGRWDEFYRSETALLRQMARKRKLSPEETEDALQRVWLAALKKRDEFIGQDSERHLHAWLRITMHHKIGDALRRRRLQSLEDLAVEPMASTETGLAAERRAWLAARLDEMEADEAPNARLLTTAEVKTRLTLSRARELWHEG